MRHSFAPSSDREPNLVSGAPNCCAGHSPASRGPPWTHLPPSQALALARRPRYALPPKGDSSAAKRLSYKNAEETMILHLESCVYFIKTVCKREGVFNKVHKSTPRKSRRITELRIMPHFDGLIPKFNPQAQRFRTKGLRFVGEQVRLSQYQGLFV